MLDIARMCSTVDVAGVFGNRQTCRNHVTIRSRLAARWRNTVVGVRRCGKQSPLGYQDGHSWSYAKYRD
jgi:hypothetical protein